MLKRFRETMNRVGPQSRSSQRREAEIAVSFEPGNALKSLRHIKVLDLIPGPIWQLVDWILVYQRRLAFGPQVRTGTWRLISDLMASRLSLNEALLTAATVMEDGGKPSVGAILRDVEKGIARNDFAQRITRYASGAETLLFRVIDKSEARELFTAAAVLTEQTSKQRAALRSAAITPLALIAINGVTLYILGTEMFPLLDSIGNMENAPWYLSQLSSLSQWFANNLALTVAPIVVAGLVIAASLPLWTGRGRALADKFPPYSLYKIGQGTGFIFTVMSLAQMGKTISPGLIKPLSAGASPYLRSRIDAIADNLHGRWGDAMRGTGHDFPARDLITVTCALDRRSGWTARFSQYLDQWLSQSEARVKAMTLSLNAVLTFFLTVMMAAIASSMGSLMSLVN